jgi:hypothetical protein
VVESAPAQGSEELIQVFCGTLLWLWLALFWRFLTFAGSANRLGLPPLVVKPAWRPSRNRIRETHDYSKKRLCGQTLAPRAATFDGA